MATSRQEKEWFGDDFGQTVDLTARLREILLQYPQGTSILKELIQNSDDAGAHEVKFCIDCRTHSTAKLPSPSLAQFQGPALLSFNSASFTDTDFASIQRIGDSLKKDASKGSKTGRFGIGFNSIYHLTELPSFVSARKWCSFDPQAAFLPNVNPSNPGKMVDFVQHKESLERYWDQFAPLVAFGQDYRTAFAGTLFRFPLRTPAQALTSKLSRQTHTVDSMRTLLRDFAAESASMLLFLKRVESFSVLEWLPGEPEPRLLHETRLAKLSPALRRARGFALTVGTADGSGNAGTANEGVPCDYELEIESKPLGTNAAAGAPTVHEQWVVCNQLGGKRATAMATDPATAHMRLVPWAGVAALLQRVTNGQQEAPEPLKGNAYCFLPLPVSSGLPVHINAYFELSSNRRDVWQGDDMAGDGRMRAEWNKALVEEIVSACYLRLLKQATKLLGPGLAYDYLWPRLERVRGLWRNGALVILAAVASMPLLYSKADKGQWVTPQGAILLAPAPASIGSEGAAAAAQPPAAAGDDHFSRLGELLLLEGALVVDCDRELQASLLAAKCAVRSATSPVVREILRLAGRKGGLKCLSPAPGRAAPRENALFLLAYCLEDVVPNGPFHPLDGLPLVPLADGSHGVFKALKPVDVKRLEKLRDYCFSESMCLHALRTKDCLEEAVQWIFSQQDGNHQGGTAYDEPFLLCSEEEVKLFSGAACRMINETDLAAAWDAAGHSASSIANGRGAMYLEAFRSTAFQRILNVASMSAVFLPDLVGRSLPKQWTTGPTERLAMPWKPGSGGQPQEAWFHSFWSYLSQRRPQALKLFAEKWPIVPTNEGVVCSLSLRSAVVSAELLDVDVRALLVAAGARTLLTGLFAPARPAPEAAKKPAAAHDAARKHPSAELAGSAPALAVASNEPGGVRAPEELFDYVRQAQRASILALLDTVLRNGEQGRTFSRLFDAAAAAGVPLEARDALRAFICREPVPAMTQEEIQICQQLPILPVHLDGLALLEMQQMAAKDGRQSLVKASGRAYAAAAERKLFLLLEPGTLVFEGEESDSDSDSEAVHLAPEHLLNTSFVKMSEGDGAEAILALRLGVTKLTRAAFVLHHLLPRLHTLPARLRDAAMGGVLVEIGHLSGQEPQLKAELSKRAFVSTAVAQTTDGPGKVSEAVVLVKPEGLFDPDVEDLRGLLPKELFPSGVFSLPDVLVGLRTLGLRQTLDWDGVVEVAAFVQRTQGRAAAAGAGAQGELLAAEAAAQGRRLLSFIDAHASRLFPAKDVGHVALFKAVRTLVMKDEAAEEAERRRLNALSKLMSLEWVPILVKPPSDLLPWRNGDTQAGSALRPRVAVPATVRQSEDMWLCSHSHHVLDGEVRNHSVRAAFAWDRPLEPSVIAEQAVSLAEHFNTLRGSVPSSEAGMLKVEGAAASAEAAEGDKSLEHARQTLAGVVPRIYQALSSVMEKQGQGLAVECIGAVLSEEPWVWVGERFVAAELVAFSSPANAAPYLYAVPPDLACFGLLLRRFGVREAFGSSDFVGVLSRMATETGVISSPTSSSGAPNAVANVVAGTVAAATSLVSKLSGGPKNAPAGPRPLSTAQVDLAVTMVQVLSDESMRVSDWSIFAPDANGVLAPSASLVYDDAPWMAQSRLGTKVRFVHPKISAGVGAKVGVRSLRDILVEGQQDKLDFGSGAEAFGQQESLTRRLRHILEMYPEGPGILSEMVQNADDAGATTVKIMYSAREHSSNSLLGPKMSEWQGPSLYVYNDAVFTDSDFQNVARIGQASKLDKLSTTGRFGLGFNAVYHLTDVPSFVSGDSLVIFDPHIKYLPIATKQQPGMKLKFPGTDLLQQFPDQFEPYLFFGCDMQTRFNGTLFRFPLRRAAAAKQSEVSTASYSLGGSGSVDELLQQFREVAPRFLLFLRNVSRIEVYQLPAASEVPAGEAAAAGDSSVVAQARAEPELLFYVAAEGRTEEWHAVPRFISGSGRVPQSKDVFYQKLGNADESALPCTVQRVKLTFQEAVAGARAVAASALTVPEEKKMRIVDEFLVVTGLGAGRAREMACDPKHRALKFIPWGGVAAHLKRNGEPAQPLAGHAFCFLPLPVKTGCPCHVNGYFELSSNRRDVWHGSDMSGEGARRSQWNSFLLMDVIAPLYSRLIKEAAQLLGWGPQYLGLLPVADLAAPWTALQSSTFATLKDLSVVFTEVPGKTWVPPRLCAAMDDVDGPDEDEGFQHTEQATERAGAGLGAAVVVEQYPKDERTVLRRLHEVFVEEGNPLVVWLPPATRKAMVKHECFGADVTPKYVRQLFKFKREPTSLNGPKARRNALFLLAYVSRELDQRTYHELVNVPFIPLADGKLARLGASEAAPAERPAASAPIDPAKRLFLANQLQRKLLADGAGNLIVEDKSSLPEAVGELLYLPALQRVSNLTEMRPADFVRLLDTVLPPAWAGQRQVAWAPEQDNVRPKQPSEDWLSDLWKYICSCCAAPQADGAIKLFEDSGWPLLPAVSESEGCQIRVLLRLEPGLPLVTPTALASSATADLPCGVTKALSKIGVRMLDSKALGVDISSQPLIQVYSNKATTEGILTAMRSALFGDSCGNARAGAANGGAMPSVAAKFEEVRAAGREALRHFFGTRQNAEAAGDAGRHALPEDVGEFLRLLPIFRVHLPAEAPATLPPAAGRRRSSAHTGPLPGYKSLSGLRYAPLRADPVLLDDTFVLVDTDEDKYLLKLLAVERMTEEAFYLHHVLPRLKESYQADAQDLVGVARPALSYEARAGAANAMLKLVDQRLGAPAAPGDSTAADLLSALAATPFVPNKDGNFVRAAELYDPRQELHRELLPAACFPSTDYSLHDYFLKGLEKLGMQREMTADGVLLSARSVAAYFRKNSAERTPRDDEDALRRGNRLLRYLDVNIQKLLPRGSWYVEASRVSPMDAVLRPSDDAEADSDVPVRASFDEEAEEGVSSEELEQQAEERRQRQEAERKCSERRQLADALRLRPPDAFVDEVCSLPWLPVSHEPQITSYVPWRRPPNPMADAPASARPYEDLWLCSAVLSVAKEKVGSKILKRVLGWDAPIRCAVAVRQLAALSDQYMRVKQELRGSPDLTVFRENIARAVNILYEVLDDAREAGDLATDDLQAVSGKACVWVTDHFVPAKQLAFKTDVEAPPHLLKVPQHLLGYSGLLRALGVRDNFAPGDLVAVLAEMHREQHRPRAGSGGLQPLAADQLELTVAILRMLARIQKNGSFAINPRDIYVPSTTAILSRASDVHINDAKWMGELSRYTFVHEKVGEYSCRILGVKSMRETKLKGDSRMEPVACPSAKDVCSYLAPERLEQAARQSSAPATPPPAAANGKKPAKSTASWLFECLALAEEAGARRVTVFLDERKHGEERLLEPALAEAQGPALVVLLDGVVLEAREIESLVTTNGPVYDWGREPRRAKNSGEEAGDAGNLVGPDRYFPPLGKGLCSMFDVTDCLQVLSGGTLYLYDPTGYHLTPREEEAAADATYASVAAAPAPPVNSVLPPAGRRCTVTVNDVNEGFRDQYGPFVSLPAVGAAGSSTAGGIAAALKSQGSCDATLVRLPLRARKSAISGRVWQPEAVEKMLRASVESARASFVFGTALQEVSAYVLRPSASHAQLLFSCALAAGAGAGDNGRGKRATAIANREWRKAGLAQIYQLFQGFVPPRASYILEVKTNVDEAEQGGVASLSEYVDQWLVSCVLAPQGTRDLALSELYTPMGMTPLLSCAAHISRSGGRPTAAAPASGLAPKSRRGRLFVGQDTGIITGLPFHIDGPFFVGIDVSADRKSWGVRRKVVASANDCEVLGMDPREARRIQAWSWNKQIMKQLCSELVPQFLLECRAEFQKRRAEALYHFWPTTERLRPPFRGWVPDELYTKLGGLPLFLSVGSGFIKMEEGIFVTEKLDPAVEEYLRSMMNVFKVPHFVALDLTSHKVAVKTTTPETARLFLRKHSGHALNMPRFASNGLALEMLLYCLSDCEPPPQGLALHERSAALHRCKEKWYQLRGLSLLPLADGTLGTVGTGATLVLATQQQQELFPRLKQRFISLAAAEKLAPWFASEAFCYCVGVVRFGPRSLADGVQAMLPRKWYKAKVVQWRNPLELISEELRWQEANGSGRAQQQSGSNALELPTPQWLAALWKEVSVTDPEVVEALKDWPLLPLTTGELALVKDWSVTVRMCPSMADAELSEALDQAMQRASSASDARAATYNSGIAAEARAAAGQVDDDNDRDDWEALSAADTDSDSDTETSEARGRQAVGQQIASTAAAGPGTAAAPDEAAAAVADQLPQPPQAAAAPQLPALPPPAAPPVPVEEPPRLKALHRMLTVLAAPVLELSYFPAAQRSQLVVPAPQDAARTALHVLSLQVGVVAPDYQIAGPGQRLFASAAWPDAETPVAHSSAAAAVATAAAADGGGAPLSSGSIANDDHPLDASGRRLRLRWGLLDGPSKDRLLLALHNPTGGANIAFQQSDKDKLRGLPVWETAGGQRVPIPSNDYFTLESGASDDSGAPGPAVVPLPPSANRRLLRAAPQLRDLLRDLGVQETTWASLVAKFVLPDWTNLGESERMDVLRYLRDGWADLRGNAELVNALKEVPLVTVNGVQTRASSWYDPTNEVMKHVFADLPTYFPQGEFADRSWFPLLGDAGMRIKVDGSVFLDCARKVSTSTLGPDGRPRPEVMAAAQLLMSHLATIRDSEFHQAPFLQKVADLPCVPVDLPCSAFGEAVDDVSDARTEAGAAGAGNRTLARFCDAAHIKDRALVFSVMPVHLESLLPQQIMWSSLGIKTPPPAPRVLAHIRKLLEGESLDRWRYRESPEKVFAKVFEFLQEHYSKLAPAEQEWLREAALVPVNGRLVRASRLFFRLKEDLSPFIFEVPRAFGAFDVLFKELGVRQEPAAHDYAVLLRELRKECGGERLNPNELGAVLKAIALLAQELQLSEADGTGAELAAAAGDIFVPDDRSLLVGRGECLYNDTPWLRGRVNACDFRAVHPKIPLSTCRLLRIASVSEVVREELHLGFEVVPLTEYAREQDALTATLTSFEFSCAIAAVAINAASLTARASSAAAAGVVTAGGPGILAAGADAPSKVAAEVRQRLQGFHVIFVRSLLSRFLRSTPDGVGEQDITADGGEEGSLVFVRESQKLLLVARPALPPSVSPAYIVATAVAQVLQLPPTAVGPLAPALEAPPHAVGRVMAALRLGGDETANSELIRGEPGQPVLAEDLSMLVLKPLKHHAKNDVVAWMDRGVARYGVVVGSHGLGYEGDTEGAEGLHGMEAVRVRLAPGRVESLLGTQIYSFRQSRAVGDGAESASALARAAAPVLSSLARLTGAGPVGGSDAQAGGGVSRAGTASATSGLSAVAEAVAAAPVSPEELVCAVQEILSRCGLTLTGDQQQQVQERLRLAREAEASRLDAQMARRETLKAAARLRKLEGVFQCQICFSNSVNKILVPCGHLLCEACQNLMRRDPCPFCREPVRAAGPFYKPNLDELDHDDA